NYTWMPVIHYLGRKNIYSEFRYNYEATGAASVYVGKSFGVNGKSDFVLTPAAGIVMGKYTGGSLALNGGFSKKKIIFFSQSQYTFSATRNSYNFFYSWSDLYYQECSWLFTGLTMQLTATAGQRINTDKGLLLGFKFSNWSIPLYFINPLKKDAAFIAGVNVEWRKK
ncbi:MAG: hypothetical protein ABUL46_00540, partial [Chitinophaga rupis]